MFRSFRGLRGKLILTYTLVTVLALLALEAPALLAPAPWPWSAPHLRPRQQRLS